VTPAEVAAALAARTEGRVHSLTVGCHDQKQAAAKAFLAVMATGAVGNPDIQYSDLSWVDFGDADHLAMVGNGPNGPENALAIVVAVNLADPLWRVAEAAREAVSEYDDAGLEHDLHYEELAESLRDLRAALADLDAAVKELP